LTDLAGVALMNGFWESSPFVVKGPGAIRKCRLCNAIPEMPSIHISGITPFSLIQASGRSAYTLGLFGADIRLRTAGVTR